MNPRVKRPVVVLAICAGFTLLFLALYGKGYRPLEQVEFFFQDWFTRLGRTTPVDSRLVLIGIDRPAYEFDLNEEDLRREPVLAELKKTFPWSRAVWARLVERLAQSGAKVIAMDLVFAAASDQDEQFHETLDKYQDRVVIGFNILKTETEQKEFYSLQLPGSTVLTFAPGTHPVADERVGFVNVWAEEDDVLRRVYFRRTGAELNDVLAPDVTVESLAARVLRKYGRPDLIPPGTASRRFRYTAPPGKGYLPHPVGDVMSLSTWEKNFANGEFFRDKIVLIGPTAPIFHDTHRSPFVLPQSQMPGPEIHLNLINAALHGEFPTEPRMFARLAIIGLAGTLAWALCFLVHQPLKRLLVVVGLSVGYWFLGQYLFNRAGSTALVIPIATPLLLLLMSSVTALTYDYLLERLEKRRVRKTLERYVSRDVVKELLDNPETYFNTLVGVRKPVTILFSDVRGFTTLTESADSVALVKQLNEYFEEMVKLVFAHQGSLDKFIGDAVMAVWGNIVSHGPAQDAHHAVATALAMRRSLQKLNEDWKARGMLELAFGIGINHGEVIVGNLGSSEKMELTVIGDAVNLASRLEGLTKEYHLDLLLGESVARLVGDTYILRTVDCVQVKGKTKPVDVFEVMGEGAGQTVSLPLWLARYEEGVRLYRSRKFAEAAGLFQESLRRQPEDFLSDMYLKRCQALIENPPDDSWNGVFVMTKK